MKGDIVDIANIITARDELLHRVFGVSSHESSNHLDRMQEEFTVEGTLYEYNELVDEIRELLFSLTQEELELIIAGFNDKGGSGKTPTIVLLALLLAFIAVNKPIALVDANVNTATTSGRLSTPINPNLLTLADIANDLIAMLDMEAGVASNSLLKHPFTSYKQLERMTHTTPQGLMFIPNEPPSQYYSLSIAHASLAQPAKHVYATLADTGNSHTQAYVEAAFRLANHRYFVGLGNKIEMIRNLARTMRAYYNRGYKECVRHALVLITATSDTDTVEYFYARLCAALMPDGFKLVTPEASDGAEVTDEEIRAAYWQQLESGRKELATFGITEDNYKEKIHLIPFSEPLNAEEEDTLPLLSLDPSGGNGYTDNDHFIEVHVAIAAAKFLKALIINGSPDPIEVKKDFERADAKIETEIVGRNGDPEVELAFFDPEKLTQRTLLREELRESTTQKAATSKSNTRKAASAR